jgi:hypothetical protein
MTATSNAHFEHTIMAYGRKNTCKFKEYVTLPLVELLEGLIKKLHTTEENTDSRNIKSEFHHISFTNFKPKGLKQPKFYGRKTFGDLQ